MKAYVQNAQLSTTKNMASFAQWTKPVSLYDAMIPALRAALPIKEIARDWKSTQCAHVDVLLKVRFLGYFCFGFF